MDAVGKFSGGVNGKGESDRLSEEDATEADGDDIEAEVDVEAERLGSADGSDAELEVEATFNCLFFSFMIIAKLRLRSSTLVSARMECAKLAGSSTVDEVFELDSGPCSALISLSAFLVDDDDDDADADRV